MKNKFTLCINDTEEFAKSHPHPEFTIGDIARSVLSLSSSEILLGIPTIAIPTDSFKSDSGDILYSVEFEFDGGDVTATVSRVSSVGQ